MWRLALVIPFVLVPPFADSAEPVETAKETRKTVIDAVELNTKYEVRGPLGEIVTVVGKAVVGRRKSADPPIQSEYCQRPAARAPSYDTLRYGRLGPQTDAAVGQTIQPPCISDLQTSRAPIRPHE